MMHYSSLFQILLSTFRGKMLIHSYVYFPLQIFDDRMWRLWPSWVFVAIPKNHFTTNVNISSC